MRLATRLRRAAQSLRHPRRQTVDENFIGFDKYRKHGAYHWRELETNSEYREKVDLVRPHIPEQGRCLDIGCGDGAYVFTLSPLCSEIVGVDADFDAVRLANEQLRAQGVENARCLQLPVSGLTLPAIDADRPFDVVYSMDVIEHLPEPAELVEVAANMASDTGVVLIGTPLYISDELVSPYHVREFSRSEIHEILASRLDVENEIILGATRLDGRRHDEGFYIGVCRKR